MARHPATYRGLRRNSERGEKRYEAKRARKMRWALLMQGGNATAAQRRHATAKALEKVKMAEREARRAA